jgi:hypothetical protein
MAEVVCGVCGEPIAENDSRFVDVDTATKAKIHVHLACKKWHYSPRVPATAAMPPLRGGGSGSSWDGI